MSCSQPSAAFWLQSAKPAAHGPLPQEPTGAGAGGVGIARALGAAGAAIVQITGHVVTAAAAARFVGGLARLADGTPHRASAASADLATRAVGVDQALRALIRLRVAKRRGRRAIRRFVAAGAAGLGGQIAVLTRGAVRRPEATDAQPGARLTHGTIGIASAIRVAQTTRRRIAPRIARRTAAGRCRAAGRRSATDATAPRRRRTAAGGIAAGVRSTAATSAAGSVRRAARAAGARHRRTERDGNRSPSPQV